MRIAISGNSGCGNTTATTNVGNALGLKIVNYTFRDLGKELGVPFEVVHKEAPDNFIYDYMTDLKLMRAADSGTVIVGSRLAAWLMDADLRIWLHASLEARAARINRRESEKNSSYESVLYKTLQRDAQNRKRYLRLYGIDLEDHSDFDITINTEMLTAEQVSSLIVAAAQWAKVNHLERKNVHMQRIKQIIAEKLHIEENKLTDPKEMIDLAAIYRRFR